MLTYKCKSHRGRSPNNRTDSLCIVEVTNRITRAFACVLENKTASVILPIITRQVAANSIIHTDEFSSYRCLSQNGFFHNTVCHKYEFVNHETGVNTQAVECFNND
jgi:transposase-like protein